MRSLNGAFVLAVFCATLAGCADPAPGAGDDADAASLLAASRSEHAAGNRDAALSLADAAVEAAGADASLLLAALLHRGGVLEASGDEYRALFDYERIYEEAPESPEATKAIERELEIGIFFMAEPDRLVMREGKPPVEAGEIGEELLIRTHERRPGTPLGERAIWELAALYSRAGMHGQAGDLYELFLENYPGSERADEARRKLGEARQRTAGPS